MKLSISNIAWKKENDKEMYDFLSLNGFSGIEIAPTRIFPEAPYDKLNEAKKWAEDLKSQYGLMISSMQSIWYGRKENIFSSDFERLVLFDYTKKAIDFARSIECKNLVFGCPKNRNIPVGLDENSVNNIAMVFFRVIGKYAYENGTVFSLEANPEICGTNFINKTKTAFSIAEQIGSSGVKVNLDFGTIIQNQENLELLKGKVHLINHVHISEPYLKAVQNRKEHESLAEILQKENYTGFVSIEMGLCEDLETVKNLCKYVKEIFA